LKETAVHAVRIGIIVGCLTSTFAACSSSPAPSASVVAARPASTNAANVSYYSQPVTLTVTNAVATQGATPVTTVEVSTDAAFTNIVTTQTVLPDANGQLTLTLGHLTAATTYYWRVKTVASESAPIYSSPTSFTVGPLATLGTPVLVSPSSGVLAGYADQPLTLVVQNPAIAQKVGAITDTFDVATDAALTNIVVSKSVPQAASNQTSLTLDTLPPGGTYYWRVTAAASDAISTASATSSLRIGPAAPTIIALPGNGTYNYTLAVSSPAICLTQAVVSGPCSTGYGDWVNADFSFDGQLVVRDDGRNLQFVLPPNLNGPWANYSTFRFQRVDRQLLNGVIAASAPIQMFTPSHLNVTTAYMNASAFSGQADNSGLFQGIFDGQMEMWHPGFPCDRTYICQTPGFGWKLTPR
jgi:hypothetical protein